MTFSHHERGDRVIADTLKGAGGEVVMTDHDPRSGLDRVHRALARIDRAEGVDVVVNLQGDLPTPGNLGRIVATLTGSGADMATLAAPTMNEDEARAPKVVKELVAWNDGEETGRTLCFTRARAPCGEGPVWNHFGIYTFRREALKLLPSGADARP